DIANAQTGDALAINTSGLNNISVVSNTGTQLVLAWNGSAGDPNNIAEVTAALEAITFSNSEGANIDYTDRQITIVMSDGETESAVATTTIDISASEATILDLNSTPSVTVDTVTTTANLVQNGNFSSGMSDWTASNRKSTRLNSSHVKISYAVFCLKKKKSKEHH